MLNIIPSISKTLEVGIYIDTHSGNHTYAYYPPKSKTLLFRRTMKISLKALNERLHPLQFAPNIKFGQTIMEQPAIKCLQQLIF